MIKNGFTNVKQINGGIINYFKKTGGKYWNGDCFVFDDRVALDKGEYKGKRISVMGTGMGIPSISIYAKELITEYNVKSLIRVGSSGSIADHLELGDIVVGVGASTDSGVNRSRFFDADFSATASWDLLHNFVHTAESIGKEVHVGNIFSGDLFYDPREETFELMKKMGILAVEMEAAGLYGVASEYGAKALAVATVSDVISKNLQMSSEALIVLFGKFNLSSARIKTSSHS